MLDIILPKLTAGIGGDLVVGLVYNYRNSLSEDFTGDAKNVL